MSFRHNRSRKNPAWRYHWSKSKKRLPKSGQPGWWRLPPRCAPPRWSRKPAPHRRLSLKSQGGIWAESYGGNSPNYRSIRILKFQRPFEVKRKSGKKLKALWNNKMCLKQSGGNRTFDGLGVKEKGFTLYGLVSLEIPIGPIPHNRQTAVGDGVVS